MPEFAHGLVIGKFYPPTPGHHFLIESALARCDRLTVLIEHAASDSIPGSDRAQWLQEIHPAAQVICVPCDIPVDLADEAVWAAQADVIATALRYRAGTSVDALLSSEGYGGELSARLGDLQGQPIQSVCVDAYRRAVPISATEVRGALHANWGRLHPVVRSGLAVRICVVGAESTGTTTLARQLADHYRQRGGAFATTQWVPELGRQHTLDKLSEARTRNPRADMADLMWTHNDFAFIAEGQTKLEQEYALAGSPLLICDTDAMATAVWEHRYLSIRADDLSNRYSAPRKGIYLLSDHRGVPFEQDGVRDGEHLRAEMTGWFQRALIDGRHSYALVTGTAKQRLALAVRIADLLLASRAAFAPPL